MLPLIALPVAVAASTPVAAEPARFEERAHEIDHERPPPPRFERFDWRDRPSRWHVWEAGHWRRERHEWIWVPGHWARRR